MASSTITQMARSGVRVSAIIIKDKKILLIHRRKPGKEYWVFPGGAVEGHEGLHEALLREVKEETNLDVLKSELIFEAEFNESSGQLQPFFLCEVSDGVPEIVGEEKYINSEHNSYHLEWKKLSELKKINLVPEAAKKFVIKEFSKVKY